MIKLDDVARDMIEASIIRLEGRMMKCRERIADDNEAALATHQRIMREFQEMRTDLKGERGQSL